MPRSLGGFGGFGGPLDDEDEDDMPPFVLPAQNDQAKFAAAQDTDDEEDDGMSFVIPSSAPAVPASKPVLKPSGLQFSTSLRMPTVPSSRRRQTINASAPTLHADAQASLGSRPALVNAEAGSSGCPNPSRSFTYPLTRHPRPTIPPHERDDLPAVSSSAYPPASLITAATTAARSTTHARISSSSSNALASPLSSPSTPRQRRPQLDLSPPMLEPLRPLSPLVSRFPSLSSIWGGLISPLASHTPSEPRMASREAQLARLRASMDIGMSHSLCNVPCSNCSTSGSIVHL
ncbi:hypothetical protein BKA62DRAFT_82151 [Auriculariales sp. MPI-PUGE-AT-0066]|nr:hypothetical protein BKA62DRAFT_82151 [Auriculariales sp. MPI-PUGE-AT-0066]